MDQSTWRVVTQYVDTGRSGFNRLCIHLEAWQIVSYTLALFFFLQWCRRMMKSEETVWVRLRSALFILMRKLPWVKKRVNEELERAKIEVEEDIHKMDQYREFYKFIPEHGLKAEEIATEARLYESMASLPVSRVSGAHPASTSPVLVELVSMFAGSSPDRYSVFPGSRKMEAEVVRMMCSHFHAGPRSCGSVASGTAETALLTTLAYRNRLLALGSRHPEVVAPVTIHPVFKRAASVLGVRLVLVPVKENNKVDVSAMKRAIGPDTAMVRLLPPHKFLQLVCSAPNYVTGTTDHVERIAQLGQRYGVPVHVDCSLGGFLIPFLEMIDLPTPPCDFRVPGVTSVSVDLDKHGGSPTPCSVVLYREPQFLECQFYSTDNWPGGQFATPYISGESLLGMEAIGCSGVSLALAWATLLSRGRAGYVDATQKVVEATRRLAEAVSSISALELRGTGDLCVVAFSSSSVDVWALADRLAVHGWSFEPGLSPPTIRFSVTTAHTEGDLVEAMVSMLTETVEELQEKPSLGESSRTSALLSVSGRVDPSLARELASIRLHALHSMPPAVDRRSLRSLSVEGRKMSLLVS